MKVAIAVMDPDRVWEDNWGDFADENEVQFNYNLEQIEIGRLATSQRLERPPNQKSPTGKSN